MVSSPRLESTIRWTARIWTAASLLFLSAFIFGGAERGNWPTATQWIGLAFFPTGIVAGLLIALWKELWGGGVAALSLIGFYVWHFVVSGNLADGPWFVVIAAPAFLFLTAGLCRCRHPVEACHQMQK